MAESSEQHSGSDPAESGQGVEGHAGLQSAERHEMEAVIDEEEETEGAIEQAEHEEGAGEG